MLLAKRLDDARVAKLKVKAKRYAVPDPELRGHYVRVSTRGLKTFWAVTRDPNGKQFWRMIGEASKMSIDGARQEAAKVIRSIRGAAPDSFEAIAEQWLKLHCAKLRPDSVAEYRRSVRRMAEAWEGRDLASIERDDITKLLDVLEQKHGTRAANYALQTFRALANWHQSRTRHYRSPIVPKMWRGERVKRDRILTDQELRAVWKQAEANGVYGALIRLALLTAQRQAKLASMKWSDIEDGVWTIATAPREKGNAGKLALPREALDIIEAQPRGDSPYVFPASGTRKGRGYVSGWSQMKRAFDRKAPIAPWVFHDLRRTARSLMSRAGVSSHVAERVMGHVLPGVEGVYDRFSYDAQKGDALQRLAATINSIVAPPPDNVRKLRRAS
jgi:integrase